MSTKSDAQELAARTTTYGDALAMSILLLDRLADASSLIAKGRPDPAAATSLQFASSRLDVAEAALNGYDRQINGFYKDLADPLVSVDRDRLADLLQLTFDAAQDAADALRTPSLYETIHDAPGKFIDEISKGAGQAIGNTPGALAAAWPLWLALILVAGGLVYVRFFRKA